LDCVWFIHILNVRSFGAGCKTILRSGGFFVPLDSFEVYHYSSSMINKSYPAVLLCFLCGSFSVIFTAGAGVLPNAPLHAGIGIVKQDHQTPQASVNIQVAGIAQNGAKSNGVVAATLVVPAPRYKNVFSGHSFMPVTSYKATAKLSVYRVDSSSGRETLVFSGNMNPMTAKILRMPPSNSLVQDSMEFFETPVNNGTKGGLNLWEGGNYRAEVIFYIQEYGPVRALSIGWEPGLVEVAGAAAEFSIAKFALAPVTEVRGEVGVSVRVVPKRGATKAQIEALQAAASREGGMISESIRKFLSKQAVREPAGAAERQPWIYSESAKLGGSPSWIFYVVQGQTYSNQTRNTQAELVRLVKAGNVKRNLPGGSFDIVTNTNILFHAK
jgi:hypothetical protein